jgi:subtilisin family serine protease
MNVKFAFIFFLFLFSIELFSQQIYFIKYKNYVTSSAVADKILTKQIIKGNSLAKLQNTNYKVDYFAKRFGKNIESLSRIIKVTYENVQDNNFILQTAANDPDIEYIEPSHTYHIDTVPNDSLVNQQWALDKIHAFDAWNITQGSDSVLVGLVDTGIDYLHPDIKNKIYINTGETGTDAQGRDKRTNGIDDDGNGFIDDFMGWDFVDEVGFPFDTTGGDYLGWDNDPMDQLFHGTFVAGIIAAETNNLTGIAGAAPKVKLLNCRAFDPTGNGQEDDAAAAILYAVQMKCKVINMSWGDNSFSLVLRDVIRYAYSQNVVLVGSAGNDGNDLPHYPSGYPEVICVGNSTEDDYLYSNSNYGSTIDLVAPGSNIWSLGLNNTYVQASGTSASAPFVSATAALILSLKNFTNEEVKQIIKSTSDDIGDPGWDLKFGAGRLNMFKALSVLAPGQIKINSPSRDFGTNKDSLVINATILSPYFVKYDLYIGQGYNPSQWTPLLTDKKNQVSAENIYQLDLRNMADTVYTVRIAVTLNTGIVTEERSDFLLLRTPPQIEVLGIGAGYYGDVSTIIGEVFTTQISVTKMYYRKKGDTDFKFISLDGFNTNNQFFKQLSYGILPKNLVDPNTIYQIFFETENLAGIKDTAMDNGNYFEVKTDSYIEPLSYSVMSYSLPQGELFADPVNFLTNDSNEVIFQNLYPSNDTYYDLYSLQNNALNQYGGDSLKNRFPRFVKDLNKDGKTDIISSNQFEGYIDEQKNFGTFSFNNIYKDTTGNFFPVFTDDLFNDGNYETISNYFYDKYIVRKVNPDLSLTALDTLKNNQFLDSVSIKMGLTKGITNNILTADINNDGIKEIWYLDNSGDLLSYNIVQGNFLRGDSVIFRNVLSSFLGNAISKGDFDGDGVDDIAVLYKTNSIAPLFMVKIFSYKNNQITEIFNKIFVDQSSAFIGFNFFKSDQSIRFVDVDNDNKSELIVSLFPYTYIFKNTAVGDKFVFYEEGTNNTTIFSGDLNHNGVKEIGLQGAKGYTFYEFGPANKTAPPSFITGISLYSIVNVDYAHLEWKSTASSFYIYRGMTRDNLSLYDSTNSNLYNDFLVKDSTHYFYSVKAFSSDKPIPLSDFSLLIDVYVHKQARIISIENKSGKSIQVKFNENIKTKIENLKAFELLPGIYPNSISAASQTSYLLTFRNDFSPGMNKIAVSSLNDFYNSPVKNDTITFNVENIVETSYLLISNYEIINPFRIKITFNLPVDSASAKNITNYTFEPANSIESVDIDHSGFIIYLNLEKKKPVGSVGIQYRLKINNLFSSLESGNISIAPETGSYIVLTEVAEDLSGVYVYPSPVKISNSSGKMTFANLPSKVKIIIFNINGIRINEIAESTTTGGVEYNLRDKNNELISSGIYIYRIVRLDGFNNEVETKVGKFSVIK